MQSRRIAATVVAVALALSATAAGAAVDPGHAGDGAPTGCALVTPAAAAAPTGALMPVSVSSNCQAAAEKVKEFCEANPNSWLCGFLAFIVVLACGGSA